MLWGLPPEEDACRPSRLMIDHGDPRRGYNREALRPAVTEIRAQCSRRALPYLSAAPENTAAKALHVRFDFVPDNRKAGGEAVYRCAL